MAKNEHVIRIGEESTAKSITHDVVTVLACWALIFPGWWIGSSAMQWAGFIMFFMVIIVKASGVSPKMTIAQARAKLDELEAAQ